MTARLSTRHIVAVLIALVAIGLAQPAAAQGQPSPGAILLAKQIVTIKNVKDIFQPIVRGVVEKTKQMFMQTNFMWQKDLDEVGVITQKQYESRVNDLVDACARIYASHFTEQVLKDLLAFYQSPIGKTSLTEEPKVLDESMMYAGNWGDALSQEVMVTMRAEMKKRGHDM